MVSKSASSTPGTDTLAAVMGVRGQCSSPGSEGQKNNRFFSHLIWRKSPRAAEKVTRFVTICCFSGEKIATRGRRMSLTIGHNFQNAPEIPPCSQMEKFLRKNNATFSQSGCFK